MQTKPTVQMLTAALLLLTSRATAQSDSGSFRLHKFAQPIGVEGYQVQRAGDSTTLTSSFKFTDRGSPVPLTVTWRGGAGLAPTFFAIQGKVSRFTTIGDTVTIAAGTATMRVDGESRSVAVRGPTFTISGYAPVAMQQLLLQYWETHGKPATIATLPAGSVHIVARGSDTVQVDGKPEVLRRYGVDGLIWGRETLWRSADGRVAALVSIDAEFDHFEATADRFEPSLAFFIGRAAGDGAAALRAQTASALGIAGPFALVGATVIDATSAQPIRDAVVVVRDGKIAAVGPRTTTSIPAGVRRVDMTGKFIVPGLWDMHAHYEQVEWGPIYLAAGVTTVRDVGNERAFITGVRDAIANGTGVGPRMLLAGVIDGPGPFALGIEQAATPERGIELVRSYHDQGFQQIKIYSSMMPPVLQAITAEAHRLGMTVTGHVPNSMTTTQAVDAGMDQINHIQYLQPMMMPRPVDSTRTPDFTNVEARNTIDMLLAHHTVVDPTLVVFEWSLHPVRVPYSELEPGVLHTPDALRPLLQNTGVSAAREAASGRQMQAMIAAVGALHRAGVPIVAGTDQVVPGYSLHRELELYVQAGFTPLEALQSATIVPARVMGLDAETGRLRWGSGLTCLWSIMTRCRRSPRFARCRSWCPVATVTSPRRSGAASGLHRKSISERTLTNGEGSNSLTPP